MSSVVFAGAVVCGSSAESAAFAEDVCYNVNGTPVVNCEALPPYCSLRAPTSAICRTAAFAGLMYVQIKPGGGRSLIHTDATYLMAQAVGFSADDAYWIAAYDEATDLGKFSPKDVNGKALPDSPALTTASIAGLTRLSLPTGGTMFHFPAPFKTQPNQQLHGLHPNPQDAVHEIMLAHLRRWALAGPGSDAPLCTGGFTTLSANGDIATGDSCFGAPNSVPINGLLSLVAPIPVPFATRTGLQVISGSVRSDQFDDWVGGGQRAADARIGIYLHTFGDRISHHLCTDAAQIVIPAHGKGRFREDFDNWLCNQGLHALLHEYETGVPFALLEASNRTTEAALPQIYDELAVFAQSRGVLDPQALLPARKAALIDNGLVPALQYPNAVDRMTAVTQVGCAFGFPPFPGAPACT